MYGESVFTTMRMIDGVMMDWSMHFDRLKRGVEFLYGPFTDGDDWAVLLQNRLETRFQSETSDRVIRLAVYRESARGLLKSTLISVNDLKIHMISDVFDKSRVDQKKLKLRTCPVFEKPNWWPPYLKAGNYLETILSQKMFMKPEDDDVLFLSKNDTVLESSVANIFVLKHETVYTAPIGPNVLDGVMRKKLFKIGGDFFDNIVEEASSYEQLIHADAIFGSNSVRGLFLVDRIDDYEISYTEEFVNKFERLKTRILNEKN